MSIDTLFSKAMPWALIKIKTNSKWKSPGCTLRKSGNPCPIFTYLFGSSGIYFVVNQHVVRSCKVFKEFSVNARNSFAFKQLPISGLSCYIILLINKSLAYFTCKIMGFYYYYYFFQRDTCHIKYNFYPHFKKKSMPSLESGALGKLSAVITVFFFI